MISNMFFIYLIDFLNSIIVFLLSHRKHCKSNRQPTLFVCAIYLGSFRISTSRRAVETFPFVSKVTPMLRCLLPPSRYICA